MNAYLVSAACFQREPKERMPVSRCDRLVMRNGIFSAFARFALDSMTFFQADRRIHGAALRDYPLTHSDVDLSCRSREQRRRISVFCRKKRTRRISVKAIDSAECV